MNWPYLTIDSIEREIGSISVCEWSSVYCVDEKRWSISVGWSGYEVRTAAWSGSELLLLCGVMCRLPILLIILVCCKRLYTQFQAWSPCYSFLWCGRVMFSSEGWISTRAYFSINLAPNRKELRCKRWWRGSRSSWKRECLLLLCEPVSSILI